MTFDVSQLLNETTASKLCALARRAGDAILEVYDRDDFGVRVKDDDSPLTEADLASNELIVAGLEKLEPQLPVLSEESREIPYEERKNWNAFWMVDPLDGTKEFIKRNGEFTVNIALIVDGEPVLGVVHAPVLDRTYWAAEGLGAFRREDGDDVLIHVADEVSEPLTVVVSRSHLRDADREFIGSMEARYGAVETAPKGSSLKLVMVAEGRADIYPRFGPTMEWDIAAAQAVLTRAGGVIETDDGTPLEYNKEDLVNPFFIARSPAVDLA
jgi:3'(2'), 5'-bisphosphate nucleotidase